MSKTESKHVCGRPGCRQGFATLDAYQGHKCAGLGGKAPAELSTATRPGARVSSGAWELEKRIRAAIREADARRVAGDTRASEGLLAEARKLMAEQKKLKEGAGAPATA